MYKVWLNDMNTWHVIWNEIQYKSPKVQYNRKCGLSAFGTCTSTCFVLPVLDYLRDRMKFSNFLISNILWQLFHKLNS